MAMEEVQRCMNLMEAMEDVSKGVKNYRTHCNSICHCVISLHPLFLHLLHNCHNPTAITTITTTTTTRYPNTNL